MRHRYAVLGSTLISLAASHAAADVLVGNLGEERRDASPVANPEFWCAQSFVVDPLSRPLSWIEAIVGDGFGSPSVVAELRSADAKGNIDQSPAGLLTTFIAPDMSGPESSATLLACHTGDAERFDEILVHPRLRQHRWLRLGVRSNARPNRHRRDHRLRRLQHRRHGMDIPRIRLPVLYASQR